MRRGASGAEYRRTQLSSKRLEIVSASRSRFPQSLDLEVFRGVLTAIVHDFILNNLALIEGAQAGTFDRRDMDEHILASALRLNESIAFR